MKSELFSRDKFSAAKMQSPLDVKEISLPNPSYHRRTIWIHWVVAHAAAAGAIAGVEQLFFWYRTWGLSPRDEHFTQFPLQYALLGLLGYVQQLILARGGMQMPFWLLSSFAGLFGGAVASIFVEVLCAMIFDEVFVNIFLPLPVLLGVLFPQFAFGAMLGWAQAWPMHNARWNRVWLLACGLGLVAASLLYVLLWYAIPYPQRILAATLAGGTYGMVTATALVRLIDKAPLNRPAVP